MENSSTRITTKKPIILSKTSPEELNKAKVTAHDNQGTEYVKISEISKENECPIRNIKTKDAQSRNMSNNAGETIDDRVDAGDDTQRTSENNSFDFFPDL